MTAEIVNEFIKKAPHENILKGIGTQRFKNRRGVVRRSRIERYLDILKVVARHGPIKQTHIMYKANLSWMELRRSLEHLLNSRMIIEIDESGGQLYAISETGLSTIYNYEKVVKILTGKDEQMLVVGDAGTAASSWNF